MNLEKIQEMWEKDSQIDPDNLHDESLKIPQLNSRSLPSKILNENFLNVLQSSIFGTVIPT